MEGPRRYYDVNSVLEQGEILARATFFEGGLPSKRPVVDPSRRLVGVVHGRPQNSIAGELRDDDEYATFVKSLGSTFVQGGEYVLCSVPQDF